MEVMYFAVVLLGTLVAEPAALAKNLDSPQYFIRECSTIGLSAIVNEYDKIDLIKNLHYHESPEVRMRAKRIELSYNNPRPLSSAHYPLINTYSNVKDPVWLESFNLVYYEEYPYEYNFDIENGYKMKWVLTYGENDLPVRLASLDFIKNKMKKGMKRKDAVALLETMLDNEKHFDFFMPKNSDEGP